MGALLESVLESLGEEQIETLLGQPVIGKAAQVEQLASVLAMLAEWEKSHLLEEIYQLGNQSRQPLVKLIRRDFPGLPDTVARELLNGASMSQRNRMLATRRLPLPIA